MRGSTSVLSCWLVPCEHEPTILYVISAMFCQFTFIRVHITLCTLSHIHTPTDKTLLGINSPGSLGQSVQILPNSSFTPLCFRHPDDNVTCEPPIVGNVQLLSSPVVSIGTPSATQVTITDDDGKYIMISIISVLVLGGVEGGDGVADL